eukprot:scaffold18260_cov57-Phaeocystis_antarctica.AAC.3
MFTARQAALASPHERASLISVRGEGRGARPRATDEQLVGGGQGVCALPSRKEGMRCAGRGAAREGGRRRATAVHAACRGGLDCRLGAGHGEERTENMATMYVTLEVSKLSGWLNADADCRESNRGHAVRGEVRAGRRQAAGDREARSVQGRELDCRLGVGHGEERT